MDDICRLCCSAKYVSNYIFDDENALYLKMSLYMPIKVFKNDKLPQKICDKCSCKVNDLYQFCNEAIEVENRLRELLLPSSLPAGESIDLTLVKRNLHSPVNNHPCQQAQSPIPYADRFTQTESSPKPDVTVKVEPLTDFQVKVEFENGLEGSNTQFGVYKSDENTQEPGFHVSNNISVYSDHNDSDYDPPKDVQSDDSDLSLLNIKRKKRRKGVKMEEELSSERKPHSNNWAVLLEKGLQYPQSVKRKEPKVKEESETVFECCVCSERLASRGAMLQHYKAHASDVAQTQHPPPAPPPPPGLRCPRCSKKMDRDGWPAHWARHWERDHRPFRCALCEKSYRQPYEILRHAETHRSGSEAASAEKRFICDTCPERFIHMKHLQAHRSRAHPEARSALRLRCAQCAREFAHLNSLRRHLVSHSGVRDFLCNVCGKKLSSREHLKLHIRIHTGHKPHACRTCGKSFVKKCNLTLHERVHSGEKPHVCSHCGKAFNQRSTLVIHERYHSGARPYACHLCGRGFVAKGLLSMHLKNTCI